MKKKAIQVYIKEAIRVGMSYDFAYQIASIMFQDTKTAKYYLLTQKALK